MNSDRKLGTMTFTTDGEGLNGVFMDHLGNCETIMQGRSLSHVSDAVETMVLLMQHRNGIVNYKPDGSIADGITESLRPRLESIAAVDRGEGYGA